MKEELKRALAGGIDLFHNHKQLRELRALGFIIECHRKHFMLVYQGKQRTFKFSVSKTPSDVRSTNNLISTICNNISKEEQNGR